MCILVCLINRFYYVACVCSGYNARSDWLILGDYKMFKQATGTMILLVYVGSIVI